MIDFVIRPIRSNDLAEVACLDGENLSPWATDHFSRVISSAHGWHLLARAAHDGTLLAFICGQLLDHEAEIHKVAVRTACRRQQIGRRLIRHALAHLHSLGARTCFLELRATNLAALNLYHSFDFQRCGLRKKYYTSPLEDAIIMQGAIEEEQQAGNAPKRDAGLVVGMSPA